MRKLLYFVFLALALAILLEAGYYLYLRATRNRSAPILTQEEDKQGLTPTPSRKTANESAQYVKYPDGREEFGGYLTSYNFGIEVVVDFKGALKTFGLSNETRWYKTRAVTSSKLFTEGGNKLLPLNNKPKSLPNGLFLSIRTFSDKLSMAQRVVIFLDDADFDSYD